MKSLSDGKLWSGIAPWMAVCAVACAEPEPLFTDETLRNGMFLTQFADQGSVSLAEGEARVSVVEGSASDLVVRFHSYSAGDLTGNGADDAAVILVEDPGGSGVFWNLHAVINEDSVMRDAAWHFLGDRIDVTGVRIDTTVITVDMLVRRQEEPAAALPTVPLTRQFVFTDLGLRVVPPAPADNAPAAMLRSGTAGLAGVDWKLAVIETEEGVVTPVMTRQGDPTLRFEEESSMDEVISGRFTGGSGCNRIFASFDAGPGAELAVGPIASTRMMCPEHVMVVEALFLRSLQIARSYAVSGDELEIRFPGGVMTLVATGS